MTFLENPIIMQGPVHKARKVIRFKILHETNNKISLPKKIKYIICERHDTLKLRYSSEWFSL